ncbi:MAG: DUF480 domain-containing protein [Gammaproteobacteria bacterium]|nr:DUF480 domain-containing protein [Gammaproteobacteria bacterium]
MFDFDLTPEETRVIGCLMEKSLVTPDQYPLTLNALINACNQKSSRNPVMSLKQGVVQHTVRELEGKKLVILEENFKRGVEKYKHRFCNTHFSELQFDSAQFAIVCALMLRGPQTPGELKTHCARLHEFADHNDVVMALSGLINREGDPLLVQLPRTPGRKDSEYMHLFSGPIDIEEYESEVQEARSSESSARVTVSELVQRVSVLEQEVAELKKLLSESEQ